MTVALGFSGARIAVGAECSNHIVARIKNSPADFQERNARSLVSVSFERAKREAQQVGELRWQHVRWQIADVCGPLVLGVRLSGAEVDRLRVGVRHFDLPER